MKTHTQSVHHQFDPQAQAYLNSTVHAQGQDLLDATQRATGMEKQGGQALDIGCGAGHLSFALAPCFKQMIALDPSAQMLATVARAAVERGLTQIQTRQSSAELLPFADASFDLVASRYSAHHWGALPTALAEMRRVLRPDGYLMMIDVMGHANPLVDTHMQTVELLRDRSHVRDRSETEWRALLASAGFEVLEYAHWPLRLEFDSWVKRMRTPDAQVAMIRTLQQEAPLEVREGLSYEEDGSLTVSTGLFWARASAR